VVRVAHTPAWHSVRGSGGVLLQQHEPLISPSRAGWLQFYEFEILQDAKCSLNPKTVGTERNAGIAQQSLKAVRILSPVARQPHIVPDVGGVTAGASCVVADKQEREIEPKCERMAMNQLAHRRLGRHCEARLLLGSEHREGDKAMTQVDASVIV